MADQNPDRLPYASLVTVAPNGTRVWRQRPFDFSRRRTVAQVDADRLSDLRNSVHIGANDATQQ